MSPGEVFLNDTGDLSSEPTPEQIARAAEVLDEIADFEAARDHLATDRLPAPLKTTDRGTGTAAGDAPQPGPGADDSAVGLGGSLRASLKEQQATLLGRHRLALAEIERRREIAGAALSSTRSRWSSLEGGVFADLEIRTHGLKYSEQIVPPSTLDEDREEQLADHIATWDPVTTVELLAGIERVLRLHAPEPSTPCLICHTSETLDCPLCDLTWPCPQAAAFLVALAPAHAL